MIRRFCAGRRLRTSWSQAVANASSAKSLSFSRLRCYGLAGGQRHGLSAARVTVEPTVGLEARLTSEAPGIGELVGDIVTSAEVLLVRRLSMERRVRMSRPHVVGAPNTLPMRCAYKASTRMGMCRNSIAVAMSWTVAIS